MILSRRALVSALGALGAGCPSADIGRATNNPAQSDQRSDVVDLSHPLGPGSPYLHVRDASSPFRRAPISTIPTRGVYANSWELTEHIGTHVDAPCQFVEQAPCLDAIPLEDLFAEAVVVDLRRRAEADADAELTWQDLTAWQAANGPFPARCAVLLCSGWGRRWPSQERFGNADSEGVLHFPGFSHDAVERLAAMPSVLGIGVDTFSIDPGRRAGFEGHRTLSGSGKWALECLANLERLPARGARIFIGAPRVEEASGSPARVVAWVPRRQGSR